MQYRKVYIELVARFWRDGGIRPLEVVWEDGRRFSVERVRFAEHAPARVDAVMPVRYTCIIGGEEKRLYFESEKERWFVEVRE